MDRSSTIASREYGLSMIQQQPHVLGAKAYCMVDLEYILKKINWNAILQASSKNQYHWKLNNYTVHLSFISAPQLGSPMEKKKIWRSYIVH